VFNAWNIFEEKDYAIKKIVMNGAAKLGELLSEVNIISKYNHPNVVMYHTCWIELANLDEINQLALIAPAKRREQEEEKLSA
jgi:hypothetical protein